MINDLKIEIVGYTMCADYYIMLRKKSEKQFSDLENQKNQTLKSIKDSQNKFESIDINPERIFELDQSNIKRLAYGEKLHLEIQQINKEIFEQHSIRSLLTDSISVTQQCIAGLKNKCNSLEKSIQENQIDIQAIKRELGALTINQK